MSAPKLIPHPTLPEWLYVEYEKLDGSRVWLVRDGYRNDEPQEEPLFTVKSIASQPTAVSTQFTIHARKWDREHGKKHVHNKRKKVS